ncbi:MAG: hypothetical protein RL095_3642 [Verrucomicrobiota bacterium]|jgi:hemolysin III
MSEVVAATYSPAEERLSAAIHGIGTLAAIAGLLIMGLKGFSVLSPLQWAGVLVYGLSLILVFLSSTLYHSIVHPPTRARLKRLDHSAIYLLIAGSYTPLLLITLQDRKATLLLIAIWLLAFAGILFKFFFIHRFKRFSLFAYLGMGWLALLVIVPLFLALPIIAFQLLVISGLSYTVGALFYAAKHLEFTHAIWHLFVLIGATCHCLMVILYVIPS